MANEYVKDMFDIWSCYMVYIKDGAAAGDYRPMVIIDWGEAKPGKVLCYPITSSYYSKHSRIKRMCFKINDWQRSNLKKESWINCYEYEKEVDEKEVEKGQYLGTLTESDQERFFDFLQRNNLY